MKDRLARGIDKVDRVGGKLFSRALGSLVLIAVVAVGLPLLFGAVRSRDWVATLVVGTAVVVGAIGVRYLFSKDRRLSELE